MLIACLYHQSPILQLYCESELNMSTSLEEKDELYLRKFPRWFEDQQKKKIGIMKNSETIDSVSLQQKKLSNQLPPITSPFLKKTVYKMFHQNDQKKPSLTRKYQNEEEVDSMTNNKFFKDLKGPKIYNSQTHMWNDMELELEKQGNQTEFRQPLAKLTKSISEVKHQSYSLDHKIYEMRNSLGTKLRPKNPQNAEGERIPTEGSHRNELTSEFIYKKLCRYNEKQQMIITKLPKELSSRTVEKEQKKLSFVTKHKLNQQLYFQQRQQIKQVKSIINNSKQVSLNKVVQIKNYTKFIPTILSTES